MTRRQGIVFALVVGMESDGVQRPTPPLTEEDLAHLEKTALSYGHLVNEDALRLIADLRASRAKVKELEAQIMATKAPTQWENRSRGW